MHSTHLAIEKEEIEFHVAEREWEFERVGSFAKEMHQLQSRSLEFGDEAGVVIVDENAEIHVAGIRDHVALPIPT